MLPEYFEFSMPTKVIYGIGVLENIKAAVQQFGKRRAILVTDKILVKVGPVELVKKGFAPSQIKIVCTYTDVPPNSDVTTVSECAALAKKHKCDLVIALGGGSVIDTAKAANLLIVKSGKLADHLGAYLLGRDETLLPFIVIPTTAGTGSEVTKVAVIADTENDVKLPFTEDQFLPQIAILDPQVTLTMPGKLTAATGMDALTHAIEAYVDKEWSPATDALALHAIRLISSGILMACAHPDNLQARGAMLCGSFLAGLAFSHSMVGMTHGIAHALGGVYHIPHGLANALVLPEVMEYNMDACTERYAAVAEALGVNFPEVIHQSQSMLQSDRLLSIADHFAPAKLVKTMLQGPSQKAYGVASKALGNLTFVDQWIRKQAALAGIDHIRNLNRKLAFLTGMPLNLKDAGISDNLDKLEQTADTAMQDGAMLYNPREPQRDAVVQILYKLYNTQVKPLHVNDEDLHPPGERGKGGEKRNIFKDTDMLYAVLFEFYKCLKDDPSIGPALQKSDICIQFVYHNPSAVITIDARMDELQICKGDFDGATDVTMTMDADFAHKFWHGKANLVSALTRRQVKAKGNVPQTMKLLPILKPAYELYPRFLRENGFEHLVMDSK